MPRKSAAAASVAPVTVGRARVQAPDGLPESAKKQWAEIVSSLPADRFHASDRPLLALYCQNVARASHAMAELERDPDGPWLKVADVHTKLVSSLAARLRLCPQSRLDRKVAGPAAREDAGQSKPWESKQ